MIKRAVQRNKYHAKKTTCRQGHRHASKREADRCDILSDKERRGEITRLIQQPQFWFVINGEQLKHDRGRRAGFQADFQYFEGEKCIVEDSKGFAVRDFPLRKALFKHLFRDIELRIV